eukprot:gnl/Spiro4/23135_TR11446_c0_g1_i1.p1 gnl/Spiro4/23135_TR11446_c0_g1~~gnl/Spiro4/23135_TR11446_c0_g1_i1.p1  ORF type:complete len:242 (+),score=40.35 gnl/Spiro4/23135_TR11446_c0_g1_i1:70-726(+)
MAAFALLPLDLTLSILERVVDSNTPGKSIIVLEQVCRTWRTLCLGARGATAVATTIATPTTTSDATSTTPTRVPGLWRSAFFLKWPSFVKQATKFTNAGKPVPRDFDWKRFYSMRVQAERTAPRLGFGEGPHDIEDCAEQWNFRCPLMWEHLTSMPENPLTRHCGACDRVVRLCLSQSEVDEVSRQGGCAAYAYERNGHVERMVGEPPEPPRPTCAVS